MLTPEDRAHLVAEHTSNGGVCRRCGRNFPCPTVEALGEVERLRATLKNLIAAFVEHCTATHNVVPSACRTCQKGDQALADVRAALAGEGAP